MDYHLEYSSSLLARGARDSHSGMTLLDGAGTKGDSENALN